MLLKEINTMNIEQFIDNVNKLYNMDSTSVDSTVRRLLKILSGTDCHVYDTSDGVDYISYSTTFDNFLDTCWYDCYIVSYDNKSFKESVSSKWTYAPKYQYKNAVDIYYGVRNTKNFTLVCLIRNKEDKSNIDDEFLKDCYIDAFGEYLKTKFPEWNDYIDALLAARFLDIQDESKDYDAFDNAYNIIKDNYNELNQKHIKSLLSKLNYTSAADTLIKELTDTLIDKQNSINSIATRLNKVKAEYDYFNKKLVALQLKENDKDFNVVDCLASYIGVDKPFTKLLKVADNCVYLSAHSDILYYEEDELEQWTVPNKPYYNKLVALLQSTRFKIHTAAVIKFNLNGTVLQGMWDDTIFNNAIPQPHVAVYSCFGNNFDTFCEAMKTNNIDYAMAILNNCLMQINLTDGIVVEKLVSQLFKQFVNRPCIHDYETDTYITPAEWEEKYYEAN